VGAAFVVALLLPTLALAGYVASGVEATRQALDPAWIQQVLTQANFDPSKAGEGANPNYFAPAVLAILLAIVFAGRWVRAAIAARKPKYRVHYRDFRNNRILDARPGETVLETLRAAGIPHASVCGGRGRRSTCRVKVGKGARRLHPRTAQEEKVAQRLTGYGTSGTSPPWRKSTRPDFILKARPIGNLPAPPPTAHL
jgi:adenylate cyclase